MQQEIIFLILTFHRSHILLNLFIFKTKIFKINKDITFLLIKLKVINNNQFYYFRY